VRPALFALVLCVAAPLAAQGPAPAASDTAAWLGGPFDRLRFRNIGPTGPSGRIDDFAVLERDPNVFCIATAMGRLWKTENGGTTLTPVFDSVAVSSIGAVAIPPHDPNLVLVGTGKNNNRQSSSWGDGVYKSSDRGRTWQRVRGNLPTVPAYEVTLHPRDNAMILATHGRGIWILDNLTPFQEGAKALAAEAHLVPVPTTAQQTSTYYRFTSSRATSSTSARIHRSAHRSRSG
jgi:photosystem II stability/assembly factor-like uncharacterized protein